MKKIFLMVVVSLAMAGSLRVTHAAMNPEAVGSIKNKEIAIGKRLTPDFAAIFARKSVFGMPDPSVAIKAGNEIVKGNNVEDPAIYISETLSRDLNTNYGTQVSSRVLTVFGDELEPVKGKYPDIDLLLDTRTIFWGFMSVSTNPDRYKVGYSARFRLVDVKGGKVMAQGFCAREPGQTPNSFSVDELLANNAETLKREIKEAADFCISQYKSKVFQF